ncbi:MAG TPA: tetratricopeptide repeat protein [Candidatus Acidoferrales bacterium]|nr:tetratricopeptide repeat protein [Candidatus Acidoferrales bacterium]
MNVPLKFSTFIMPLYLIILTGCGGSVGNHAVPRFGIGGRYNEGREQFTRGRGGDMDTAIAALEAVVKEDPTYKDSLTLLGRAYYRKARYQDAYQMLQRAVVVNKEDEVAWLVLGMTQLQLGDDQKGVETLKGGITLISKVAVLGYRNYPEYDVKGAVRTAIRRSAFEITKGVEAKQEILRSCDTLLARMDDEENYQKNVAPVQYRQGL